LGTVERKEGDMGSEGKVDFKKNLEKVII